MKPTLERLEDRTLPSFYVGELVVVTDPGRFGGHPHVCRVEGIANQSAPVLSPAPFQPGYTGWWFAEPARFIRQ